MDFEAKQSEPQKQRSDCIVVAVFEGNSLSPAAGRLDEASGGQISRILNSGDLRGKPGETLIGVAKTKGATGRPVPLLVEFLLRRCAAA